MPDDSLNKKYRVYSWLLLGFVIVLPIIAWASLKSWKISNLTALSIFPILGLWAWSIMWTHYILGTWRVINPAIIKDEIYAKITKFLVLLLIVLHPSLLVWSQWKFRGVLPPGSIYDYVNSSLKIFVFFGTVSLLLFLSFDILEKYKNIKWAKRNWHWISISQMLAMTLIFFHALALGNLLEIAWLEFYWVILGALLIPCFGLIGRNDWQ